MTNRLRDEGGAETADAVQLERGGGPENPHHPERSPLPPVRPPQKLPVPGVPTDAETRLVDAEHTRFRSRSKYRAWA